MSFFSDFKKVLARRAVQTKNLNTLIGKTVVDLNAREYEPHYVVFINLKNGKGVTHQFSNNTLHTEVDFLASASHFVELSSLLKFATPVFKAKVHINENDELVEVQHCYKVNEKCYLAYNAIRGKEGTYSLISNKPAEHAYKVKERPEVKEAFLKQFMPNKKEILEELSEQSYQLYHTMLEKAERHNDTSGFEDEYSLLSASLLYFENNNPELVKQAEEQTLEMQKK